MLVCWGGLHLLGDSLGPQSEKSQNVNSMKNYIVILETGVETDSIRRMRVLSTISRTLSLSSARNWIIIRYTCVGCDKADPHDPPFDVMPRMVLNSGSEIQRNL